MNRPLTLVGVAALALASFTTPSQAQDHSKNRAAKIFESRCASCHTVPDLTFPTDKAWLGQILETS